MLFSAENIFCPIFVEEKCVASLLLLLEVEFKLLTRGGNSTAPAVVLFLLINSML